MNFWTRRILGVLPIVGCGAGLAAIALAWENAPHTASTIAVLAAFAVVYLLGAVAGIMLLEGRRRAKAANLLYWLIQTLQFSTVPLAYALWTPLSLVARWNHRESSGTLAADVGSIFRLSINNAGEGSTVGLNLFAVLCCVLLWLNFRRQRGAPAADIDDAAILAALSADKPGFGRWRLPDAARQPVPAAPINAS